MEPEGITMLSEMNQRETDTAGPHLYVKSSHSLSLSLPLYLHMHTHTPESEQGQKEGREEWHQSFQDHCLYLTIISFFSQ